jgi:cobalt-zinc-cadmium efflux system outer membrane protein
VKWALGEPLRKLPDAEPVLEHLERVALKQRLDVDAARRQGRLLDTALGLAKTSRFTGLVNVGVHMHQDPDGPRLLGPTMSLELPIFDQRQGLIARLEAERQQARRRLSALAIDARSEVRQAQFKMLTARRAVERYQRALLPMRETIVQESQLEYNAMQIGLYELISAKNAQIATYRGYIESVRDYWIARADLERALGGRIPAAASGAPAPGREP